MGIVRISLSILIVYPMRSLGNNSGRCGVGWWEFSHNSPPTYSTNGYLFGLIFYLLNQWLKFLVPYEINTFVWCFCNLVCQCVILWHYEYLPYCLVLFSGITAWKIVIFSGWLMIDLLLTIISKKKWLKPAE